jgi:DNA-3-methyladenine glycosylase I
MLDNKTRCFGNNNPDYAAYHDREWGIPCFDDHRLFEMLILEGAQAGLSWETILKKRAGYREAFHHFDVQQVAAMSDQALEALRHNSGIIRNRAKIASARNNARVFIAIQNTHGHFADYLWRYVDHTPIDKQWKTHDKVPVSTTISAALSSDLKKRGMTFVGPTIMYAYMQSVGMVNDHLMTCWLRT